MRIHDVFHDSFLRPYHRKEGNSEGAPPAFMPSGDIHHKVEAVLNNVDDVDNIHWYEVKWADIDISWITESNASNCRERVNRYFARKGIDGQRLFKLGLRRHKSLNTSR